MTQPRRLSRPERLDVDSHPRVRIGRPIASAVSARPLSPSDGNRIDPGRLIETAVRNRCQADDPETYVLAWLALLRGRTDVPWAAAALKARLLHLRISPLSPWQRRIIELLALAARYRRVRPASARSTITSLSRKGTS